MAQQRTPVSASKPHPRLPAGKRPVRLQDIADLAHTSVATVSMALAGSKRISDQTRQRICELSQQVGYRPRGASQKPSRKPPAVEKTLRVGFLVYDRIDQPSNATLLQIISSIAAEDGIRIELVVADPRDTSITLVQRAKELASHVHGLILVGPVSIEQLHQIHNANIPAVMFGYPLDAADECELPAPIVTSDWQAMGHRAAREMFALGHRRIGFVCGHIVPGMLHERCLDGYLLAHQHAGHAADKSFRFILPTGKDIQTTNLSTLELAQKICAMKSPPTAYIFINTGNAQRLHDAMQQLGVPFAPDHAIVSHTDCQLRFPKQPVVIHINLQDMAHAAFAQLRAKCQDITSPNTVLHVPFILRQAATA